MKYYIRPARNEEWETAMSLAWCTFQKFEAPEYTAEGAESFLKFISDSTLYKMFCLNVYKLYVAIRKTGPQEEQSGPASSSERRDAQNESACSSTRRGEEQRGSSFLSPGRGEEIIGLITIREDNLISLLFVNEKYHRRGIGKNLIIYAATDIYEETGHRDCFVNAAPYALEFYHKLGFRDVGGEKENQGVRYTPMKLTLK